MSIEEVASRAGVGKATIYRRWPSRGALVLDAFVAEFLALQPLPETGTLAVTCSPRCELLDAVSVHRPVRGQCSPA